MPSHAAPIRRCCLALLPVVAACSGGSSTPEVQIPTFAVTEVYPVDGQNFVDRRSEVRVRFDQTVSGLGLQDLTIEDGAGPLAGLLEAGVDGRSWRWQPQRDLPYGALIRIRLNPALRSQNGSRPATVEVASFRVHDHVNPTPYYLGGAGEGAVEPLIWSTGQIAVAADDELYEIVNGAPMVRPLPVLGDVIASARDDIGGYTILSRAGYSPFVLEAAQGTVTLNPLTSTLATQPSVWGRLELVVNGRGDAAAYVFGLNTSQSVESLFLGRAGTANWLPVDLSAAGAYPLRRIAIDGEGNLFVAFVSSSNGRLQLQRHDRVAGSNAVFDVAGLPDEFQVSAMGNGEAQVWWRERRSTTAGTDYVRLARRYRSGTLRPAVEVDRGEEFIDRVFASAQLGAAVAISERPASATWVLQRFEADGRVGTPDPIVSGAPMLHDLAIAARGEAWFVWVVADPAGDRVMAVRSRPGLAAEAPREVFRVTSSALRIRRLAVDVEDTGRVVVAVVHDHVGPTRILNAIVLQ